MLENFRRAKLKKPSVIVVDGFLFGLLTDSD